MLSLNPFHWLFRYQCLCLQETEKGPLGMAGDLYCQMICGRLDFDGQFVIENRVGIRGLCFGKLGSVGATPSRFYRFSVSIVEHGFRIKGRV